MKDIRYTREANKNALLLRWAVAWWNVKMTLKQTVVYCEDKSKQTELWMENDQKVRPLIRETIAKNSIIQQRNGK